MNHFFDDEPQPEFFDYKHVGGRFLGLVGMAVLAFAAVFAGAVFDHEAVRLLLSFRLHVLLHDLHGRLVLDARASCGGCRMERSRPAAIGKHRQPACGYGDSLYSASCGGSDAWKWMQPENAHDPLLLEKAAYLNKPFFYARAIVYFVFFVVSSSFLRAFSIAQDSDGAAVYTVVESARFLLQRHSFAVCLTFAAVDWLMGLDYHWYSTMWGVYIFAGTALSSDLRAGADHYGVTGRWIPARKS